MKSWKENVLCSCQMLWGSGMLDPQLCKYVGQKARLPCWPPRSQQVLHQRWNWGILSRQATKHASDGSTLALKRRADVAKSTTHGYRWLHKKESCPPKIYFPSHKDQRQMLIWYRVYLNEPKLNYKTCNEQFWKHKSTRVGKHCQQ